MSIPSHLYHMNNLFRNFPSKANFLIKDFFEAYVDTDL